MKERIITVLTAFLIATLQVQLIGAWPIWGAEPNLIAAGAVAFCTLERFELGLWWIVVGGLFLDTFLPIRLGTTTVLLLLEYGLMTWILKKYVHELPFWGYAIVAGVFVAGAELPLLVTSSHVFMQWLRDAVVGAILVLPIAAFMTHATSTKRAGLRL